ncbi:DUF1836 domain-containing protein [Litchfieldia alkalitelluris]|uniref:DUF1836 domain-containing protein n=1 Tax=Litchfieldia alkalitelluris TaxID=304268 RepID=UPI0009964A3B|nr:DUF1836 domain-containing protein [Litchfieldia alkalitelluris]
MGTFELSRSTLVELLITLRENTEQSPIETLKTAWETNLQKKHLGSGFTSFSLSNLPPVLAKVGRLKPESAGLSINDIAHLGNLLEFAKVTSTAIQNWVKRDIKELIGPPMLGKKYSIDQAAILFIVEDLKMVLDFESIRKVLTLVFNNPIDRTDDIIDPVMFYKGYSDIFKEIYQSDQIERLETVIEERALQFINSANIDHSNKETVKNLLSLAVMAIFTSCYQSKARLYLRKTIL